MGSKIGAAGIILILGWATLSGCISASMAMQDPREDKPGLTARTIPIVPRTEGSLWEESGRNFLFSDVKAKFVGDLVTILVVESSSATRKAGTETGRESSLKAGVENFWGLESDLITASASSTTPKTLITASSSNAFKGEGSTSREDKLSSTMTGMVTDVLPTGNLVIEGTKKIRVNAETQIMTVKGMIRPEDIGADNTVRSTAMANAEISYHGRGVISDKQHPGWGTRAFDWVWPF